MIGALMLEQCMAQQQAQHTQNLIWTHRAGIWWPLAFHQLQAATSLEMQLQIPAGPDLRAHVMRLEGCSLSHAQPRLCQLAFASARWDGHLVC